MITALLFLLSFADGIVLVHFIRKPTHHDELMARRKPKEKAAKAHKQRAKKEKKLRKSKVATLQSLRILDVSLIRFKNISTVAALIGFFVWYFVSLNFFSALIMATLAYQLPGMWFEQKGSKALNVLQKQISVFVSSFNDVFFAGRTIRDALETAAKAVKEPPMERYTAAFLRRLAAGENEAAALDVLAKDVDHPSFSFFVDLVKTVRVSGAKTQGFRELDWKFREEESMQAETRGEIFMYMMFTIVMFAVNPAVMFIYRFLDPAVYKPVPTHLAWVPILSAVGSVIVFHGIRKFSRLRVTI
ncbi:bacterial type II secretion system protein F domain protein [Peptococcaceae bacterium CEB3]|nr:bacterial type II secretion system protein F domain protein [Peptococcaceae bacterium CEB3]